MFYSIIVLIKLLYSHQYFSQTVFPSWFLEKQEDLNLEKKTFGKINFMAASKKQINQRAAMRNKQRGEVIIVPKSYLSENLGFIENWNIFFSLISEIFVISTSSMRLLNTPVFRLYLSKWKSISSQSSPRLFVIPEK